jgi:hypothetical protein
LATLLTLEMLLSPKRNRNAENAEKRKFLICNFYNVRRIADSLGINDWTGDSKSPVQYISPKLENVQKNNYQKFLSSCISYLRIVNFILNFGKEGENIHSHFQKNLSNCNTQV